MHLAFLHPFSYLVAAITFIFVTLSLASGLLYLAEVIEEHSSTAKAIGHRIILVVAGILVFFCVVDGIPVHLTALNLVCHAVYRMNLSRTWPFISLTSLPFLASCVLCVVNHFAHFYFFSEQARNPRHHYGNAYGRTSSWGGDHKAFWNRTRNVDDLSTMDVAAFFAVIWLVPFFLFLSLSANDNVLPSAEQAPPTPSMSTSPKANRAPPPANLHQRKHSSIFKQAVSSAFSLVPPLTRKGKGNNQWDGLIASPKRSAPPSPAVFEGHPYSPMLGGGSPLPPQWGTPPLPPRLSPRPPDMGGFRDYREGGSFRDEVARRGSPVQLLKQPPLAPPSAGQNWRPAAPPSDLTRRSVTPGAGLNGDGGASGGGGGGGRDSPAPPLPQSAGDESRSLSPTLVRRKAL